MPLAFAAGSRVFGQNRYQPTWESIDQRPSPAWYTDSKFGIFIHWGVYSVPSYAPVKSKGETMYAEWYWNSLNKANSSTRKFHDRNYGAAFPYFDFAPMFRAELYNPDHWADIIDNPLTIPVTGTVSVATARPALSTMEMAREYFIRVGPMTPTAPRRLPSL